MKYSREYLGQRSANTGFRPDTLEKVLRLLRLLEQVTRHPFLGSRLLLKGGTALNLFYAAAPRLSVDLDFNYVGAVDRAQMLQERPEVERAVNQLVMGEGYRVQWGRDEHAGRKLYLTYVSGLGSPDGIEVDLNYLFRVALAEPERLQAWTPDPDSSSAVKRSWPASSSLSLTGSPHGTCTTSRRSPPRPPHTTCLCSDASSSR